MKLDGSSTVDDIGVGFQTVSVEPAGTTNGAATIVDAQTGSPNYSKTYSRSTTQVLQIVTGSVNIPAAGAKYTGRLSFPTVSTDYSARRRHPSTSTIVPPQGGTLFVSGKPSLLSLPLPGDV